MRCPFPLFVRREFSTDFFLSRDSISGIVMQYEHTMKARGAWFWLGQVLLVVLFGVWNILLSASAQEPTAAPTPSPLGTEEALPVPVLTVSAGTLPTSPFTFFDHFDEWVEEHVFTFGITQLRAHSLIRHAAERIAELQVLDGQGLRTPEVTMRLFDDYRHSVDGAARIVEQHYLAGRRPSLLAQDLVRTTIASTDALLPFLEAREETEEGSDRPALTPRAILGVEHRVQEALRSTPGSVPADMLTRASTEFTAAFARRLSRLQNEQMAPAHLRSDVASAQRLVDAARLLFAQGNPLAAFDILRELRVLYAEVLR